MYQTLNKAFFKKYKVQFGVEILARGPWGFNDILRRHEAWLLFLAPQIGIANAFLLFHADLIFLTDFILKFSCVFYKNIVLIL